jgi:hypothetical protein
LNHRQATSEILEDSTMKHHRLFWFLCLMLAVSLSCNLPGIERPKEQEPVADVTSVSVTPHRGTGFFSAAVEGTRETGSAGKLKCYISPDAKVIVNGPNPLVYGPTPVQWSSVTNSFIVSFTFTYTEPGTHSLICLLDDDSLTTWSDDFEVGLPILTITASSATITYGESIPIIRPTYSGFVAGDDEYSLADRPICGTDATSYNMVGSFRSYCGYASTSKYTINYISGLVEVNPAPLIITASSATMTQGGSVPTITPAYSGFVAGNTVSSVTIDPYCWTTATSTSPVGTYPSSCAGASAINYTISYLPGSVTVTQATTTLVLNGTFKLPESKDYTCPNGKLIHTSLWAATGTLVLTVDYTKQQASVTLQGSGQGTRDMCNYSLVATESYTIDGVTLNGTFDPSTNALTITGELSFPLHSSCQIIDETINPPACIAGDQTIKSSITLNGSIDHVNSTGQGQIQWTGSEDWGEWHAP